MKGKNGFIGKLENLIFEHRAFVIGVFVAITLFMGFSASKLRIDAGFAKLLPLKHEYMKTYMEYRDEFGGANRVLIAIMARDGNMFTPEFFDVLKAVTDEVFFIEGVDRAQVSSLFTPNTRFTEVVEDGIAGGNVVPDDFENTPEGLEQVRKNILKAGIVGRLVANDFSGAVVSARLLEINPNTGERLDYIRVAKELERIRENYESDAVAVDVDVHIIGFAKVIGDIAQGASVVVLFLGIALLITAVLVYAYSQSFRLTIVPVICSLIAVIWQLGSLPLLGFGIDPMSILVPFLVFAIGVSHGVQMVSANSASVFKGASSMEAARDSFRRLLIPGGIALASDTIGFLTIYIIEIQIIREMAITASLGVAAIILTNLILVPVLLSLITYSDKKRKKFSARQERLAPIWEKLSGVARPRSATIVIGISVLLLGFGLWKATAIKIGDLHRGVPELRADSRYNVDSEVISERFAIGVDLLTVICETKPEGCIDHEIMTTIDDFEWRMRNTNGVQSVIALPGIAKVINSGWNEGSQKYRVLPRNQFNLAQATRYVETGTGLLNADCSVMPVMIFTRDHKAETISHIVAEVKRFQQERGSDQVNFRLATGNVGVMAATNEAVDATQFPILLCVFSAIILLCLITFRSFRAMLCIVLPLGLVSLLAYALMTLLQIGLKTSTLPVVALGVGIGVDYGIYIFSRFQGFMKQGLALQPAFQQTLKSTGIGVVFTGITLAIGVVTWIFAPLKFQADMGILLTFMFLVNMLGAIFLLPALACVMFPKQREPEA